MIELEINHLNESAEQTDEIVAGVRNLRLIFSGEESRSRVFNDLTLEVHRGEKILLLGPSGCGKSTLLQVLSGIIPELVEVPMRCSSRTVPASRGVVFQDPDTQFCMPYVDEELAFVMENLSISREEMPERINNALQEVGLVLEDAHVPINSLSQGMKQRLALASVLLSDPEVLFLDEPSALLDPEGREQIWQAVSNISNNRTLIIVEHRIEELLELGLVDNVALFGRAGELLALAPPDQIFEAYKDELVQYGIWYPGVWKQFFQSPFGRSLVSGESVKWTDSSCSHAPIIELQDFCGLRGGQPVIKVEELKVYPGDFIAVTGANGAGKSSLLLSLMGLLKISGNYLLQDQQMVDIKKRKTQIRTASQHIGFVFQNPEYQFIEETVSKEIAFSLREAGMPEAQLDHKVRNALERFGLLGFEARHPFQLSLGQKRRLSVAGAVVMEKSVLLLDEPTFGQDAVNTFEILTLCEELRVCGAAIIMVTHEEMIANHMATRRWEINGGTLRQSMTARGSELMPGSRTDAEQRIAGVMV